MLFLALNILSNLPYSALLSIYSLDTEDHGDPEYCILKVAEHLSA